MKSIDDIYVLMDEGSMDKILDTLSSGGEVVESNQSSGE